MSDRPPRSAGMDRQRAIYRAGAKNQRPSQPIAIEEVGRIHRYGNIEERPLQFEVTPPPRDEGGDSYDISRTG